MRHFDISSYQKANSSFRKRLVYHAGIDCGFFVELNYMINAMLYCLAKGYRFELYSEDANYGTGKGWTEYFEPFCDEVHETFHHKYNLHRPPQWHRIIRHAIKTRSLSFVFWKLKLMEARLVSGKQIIEALHPVDGECIFALADNYLQLEIVRSEFPHLYIVSLCQPEDQGYSHKAFCTLDSKAKRAAIIRLIVSVDLLLHAKKFAGSITTGPSVFILKQRYTEPSVFAVDCAKEMIESVLTLPIDQRATLSANKNIIT